MIINTEELFLNELKNINNGDGLTLRTYVSPWFITKYIGEEESDEGYQDVRQKVIQEGKHEIFEVIRECLADNDQLEISFGKNKSNNNIKMSVRQWHGDAIYPNAKRTFDL
jgi:hypothetical protein